MKRLDWDSQFWGVDIYNVDDIISFKKKEINDIQKNSGKWLIQALIPENYTSRINILEDNGFRFIENKITLKKNITKRIEVDYENFNKIKKQEIDSKRNLFYPLYGDITRFNLFSKEKINDFYYKWVINSIKGQLDDKCIGYYIENQLAGFVTYRFNVNGVVIGLFGIFPEFQRKGISQKLLAYVNNDSIKNNYSKVFVSTQGKNINAINAYVKDGFVIYTIKQWYYLKGGQI